MLLLFLVEFEYQSKRNANGKNYARVTTVFITKFSAFVFSFFLFRVPRRESRVEGIRNIQVCLNVIIVTFSSDSSRCFVAGPKLLAAINNLGEQQKWLSGIKVTVDVHQFGGAFELENGF